uniref:Uncharacterized protein n=1 Tax=Anguilla anguilla TaxID=7936 RepID=A0A0E9Q1U2_ANGAN
MGQWVHTGFRIVFSLLKKRKRSHTRALYTAQKKTKKTHMLHMEWKKQTTKKIKLKNKDFYMVNYLYRLEMN